LALHVHGLFHLLLDLSEVNRETKGHQGSPRVTKGPRFPGAKKKHEIQLRSETPIKGAKIYHEFYKYHLYAKNPGEIIILDKPKI